MDYRTSFLPLLLAIGLAAPAQAATPKDIQTLSNLVAQTGTDVLVRKCPNKYAGYYEYDKDTKVDRLILCENNIDMANANAVWETLAHESTHVMQACLGNTAFVEEEHPGIWRDIKVQAPHYAKILNSNYGSNDSIMEAEAFWMELQHPADVISYFEGTCAKQLGK
jgi:hypothetical protein